MHEFQCLGRKQASRWLKGHCRSRHRDRVCPECNGRSSMGRVQRADHAFRRYAAHAALVRSSHDGGACRAGHRGTRGKEARQDFANDTPAVSRPPGRRGGAADGGFVNAGRSEGIRPEHRFRDGAHPTASATTSSTAAAAASSSATSRGTSTGAVTVLAKRLGIRRVICVRFRWLAAVGRLGRNTPLQCFASPVEANPRSTHCNGLQSARSTVVLLLDGDIPLRIRGRAKVDCFSCGYWRAGSTVTREILLYAPESILLGQDRVLQESG